VWRVWFDQVHLPSLARKWSADLLLSMNNQAALGVPCPQMVLFHNAYYIYPVAEWPALLSIFERASLLVQRQLFALAAPRCACVVAQTAVAAKRLHQQYGIDPTRLAIVPNAVAPEHHGPHTEASRLLAARMRNAAAGRIGVLTLARYYPHKDLEFIVRVARRLRDLDDRRFVFFITVAAEQHSGARALLNTIDGESLGDEIVNIGPVGYGELRSAYQAAQICFLPTVLESMSGTYLEALQYQMPVVTTDRDFARDACGAAAQYFPPGDIDAAIHQLRTAAETVSSETVPGGASARRSWTDVCRDLASLIDSVSRSNAAPDMTGEHGCPGISQKRGFRYATDSSARHQWRRDDQSG